MSLPAPLESPTPCCKNKPHLLIGTYYSVKNGLAAKLLLNNKGPDPLTASPTLFSLSGQRFDVPPVTIDGHSFQMIDMSGWIKAAGLQFEEGSIEVFHLGNDLVLGAQVYLEDQNQSLSFDEKLVETQTFKSTHLEGLWWLPSEKGQILLALSNNSDASITATVSAEGRMPNRSGTQTLNLGANETRVIDLQTDVIQHANGAMAKYGGISVTYAGAPGALYARAMAQDRAVGYSLSVQFSDPAATKSSQLQGVGLRLGFAGGEALNPVAVIRNVGTGNSTITGRVSYDDEAGATNVIPISELHLASGEIANVDLGKLLRRHVSNQTNAIGSLELEYSSANGTVIASALSASGSGNQVFRVPMWDIYALRSSTGGYPWSINGNSATFVYIKNSSNHQQHYFMNVHYDGGDYRVGRKTIEAGESVIFDLRKLRDEQVPDIHGDKIPLSVSSGQIHWTKTGIEDGVLIGRSEQVDSTLGISSNYACANCCDDSATSGRIEPSSATIAVGETYNFVAIDNLQDCYGYSYPQEVYAAQWSSSDENVASVSVGQATANGAGTATITADFYDTRHVVVLCGPFGNPPGFGGDCCDPRQVQFTPHASLTVKPSISQDKPLWYFGYLLDTPTGFTLGSTTATLTANGASQGTFQWTVTQGSSKVMIDDTFNITTVTKTNTNTLAIRSISYSTSANDVTIQLTYTPPNSSNSTTVDWSFSIDSPYQLVSLGATTNRGVLNSCATNSPNGTNGFQSLVPYRIVSFFGVTVANVDINEGFSGYQQVYPGATWTFDAGGLNTTDGTFQDNICAITSGTPHSLPPQSPLSSTLVDILSQTWYVGPSLQPAIGVEVQTDDLKRYQDHGLHASIVSPVPNHN
ncbi:MAG: hypothetical protein QOG23_2969 [Blastocatellia bacterium]|nr:hypothetical protein [Blastocatellia bacterium]